MEKEELKQQMMGLWKTTFHDSDAYIRLVFDTYFDMANIEYEERDGRVIASLMAIPYTFGNDNYAINSIYLCGLSTNIRFRKEGIMTSLLKRIEEKMRDRGYSFMFLIPAEDGLKRYYFDRGFINGFYRSPLHYTSLHDFRKDYYSTISEEEKALYKVKAHYFDSLETEILSISDLSDIEEKIERMEAFITECERTQRGFALYQNPEQIRVFLKEALMSGGRISICKNGEGEISGIGLYSFSETEIREIGRYAINYGSLCKIREAISKNDGGRTMTVYQLGYEKSNDGKALWNPMFSTVLPTATQVGAVGTIERIYNPSQHSKVYGMVRILSVSEILKFQANSRNNLKYSILVRLEKTGKVVEFTAKGGSLEEREVKLNNEALLSPEERNKNARIMYIRDKQGNRRTVMSERDLGELLFRRPSEDRLIEEAFGLPALNGKISLLLD